MDESTDFKRVRKWVMFVNCLAVANFCICNLAWSPMLSDIAKSLQTDMGQATQLMAIFALTSAIGLIVGGFLCDRIGLYKVLLLCLFCAVVPVAVIPLLQGSFSQIFYLRLLQGFSGGVLCNASPVLATWYPPLKRGVAGGFIALSAPVGGALGGGLAPVLCGIVGGWQQAFVWLSLPGWINIFLIFYVMKMVKTVASQTKPTSGSKAGSALGLAMRSPVTWIGVCVAFCIAWAMQGAYGLIPPFLATEYPVGLGYGALLAGQLMLALMIAGILGPLIAGVLLDKAFSGNPKPVIIIGFILSAIFLYTLQISAISGHIFTLIIDLALVGGVLLFLYPAMQVMISQIYPVETVGSMLGLWMGVGTFGGSAAMFASSISVNRSGSYDFTIVMLAIAAFAGFLLTMFMRNRSISNP